MKQPKEGAVEVREAIVIIEALAVVIHVVVVDTHQEKNKWKTATTPHNN
jgi:hypothetical protein